MTARRGRRRRRLLIAGALLAGLVAAAGITAECVRRSDLPRRWVERSLRASTGLDVRIDSLRPGWLGATVARGVRARTILASAPLIEIKVLTVTHASLVALALTRKVALESATADGVTIDAHEDELGQWNVRKAWDRIAAARDSRETSSSGPALPAVRIQNGRLDLRRNGVSTSVPFRFEGTPEAAGLWTFAATLTGAGTLRGRLDTGPALEHRLDFDLTPTPELLHVLLGKAHSVRTAGVWRGRIDSGTLAGRLSLDQGYFPGGSASGTLDAEAANGGLTIRPLTLALRLGTSIPEMTLGGGEVAFTDRGVMVRALRATTTEGEAFVEGTWDQRTGAGEADIAWGSARSGLDAGHWPAAAEAGIQVRRAPGGEYALTADLSASGAAADGAWDVKATLGARGASWRSARADLRCSALTWEDDAHRLDLSGLRAQASLDGHNLTLVSLHIPGAERSEARGRLNLQHLSYDAALNLSRWHLPIRGYEDQVLDLEVSGSGRRGVVDAAQARLTSASWGLSATGSYRPADATPLAASVEGSSQWEGGEADAITRALLRTRLSATGSVRPLALSFTGSLAVSEASIGGRGIEEIEVPCEARLGAEGLLAIAQEVPAFGGTMSFTARVNPGSHVVVDARCEHIDLATLSLFAELEPAVEGRLGAEFRAEFDPANAGSARGAGRWSAESLRAGAFEAEFGAGDASLADGRLTFSGAEFTQGAGRLLADAEASMASPSQWSAVIDAEGWPLTLPGAEAVIDASVRGSADFEALTGDAEGRAVAAFHRQGREEARLESSGSLDGRLLRIEHFRGQVAGGELQGSGSIALDDWASASGSAEWTGLDLASLAALAADTEGFTGTIAGRATVASATQPGSPPGVRVALAAEGDAAAYKGLSISSLNATVHHHPARTTLEAFDLLAADGRIGLWATTTLHEAERYVYSRAVLENLDLEPILHLVSPQAERAFGRLSGEIAGGGYIQERQRLFGEATLRVTESDLIDLPVLALIFGGLQPREGSEPNGVGTAHVRLEGDTVNIDRARYFNRGTDVVLSGRLHKLSAGKDSPISGVAVGLVRPLSGMNLPLAEQIDRILTAVQTDAVNVYIGGTLGEPETRVVPFAEVKNQVTQLIRGE